MHVCQASTKIARPEIIDYQAGFKALSTPPPKKNEHVLTPPEMKPYFAC